MTEPSATLGPADCGWLLAHTTFDGSEQAVRIKAALQATQSVGSVQTALTTDKTGVVIVAAPSGTAKVVFAYMAAGWPSSSPAERYSPAVYPLTAPYVPPAGFPIVGAVALNASNQELGAWAPRLTTVPAAPPPPPPPSVPKVVGINTAWQVGAQTAPLLQDAKALGVQAVRVEGWASSDFSTARGVLWPTALKMLPLVNSPAVDWNSGEWEQHVKAAVPFAELGAIEVANEADNKWTGQANGGSTRPVDYANMIVRAAKAVEGTGTKVLACASSMWQVAQPGWLAAMLGVPAFAAMLKTGQVELTVHPYGPLGLLGGEGYNRLAAIKAMVPGVRVWVTEVGEKAFNSSSQPQFSQQAEHATRYLADLKADPQLAAVFWFAHREWGPFNPTADNGWGLVGPSTASGVYNGQNSPASEHRPAWAAFQAAALGIA